MSCLKEADTLKHRNPIVATMHKKDHNQLWNGLLQHKYDLFWSINRRLMVPDNPERYSSNSPSEPVKPLPTEKNEYFRHIPFRLYIVSTQTGSTDIAPVFHQKLVKPVDSDGEPTLFRDLLIQVLGKESLLDKYRFVTQGIEPVLNTPLQWMSEHMSFLDNFLHIIAFDK